MPVQSIRNLTVDSNTHPQNFSGNISAPKKRTTPKEFWDKNKVPIITVSAAALYSIAFCANAVRKKKFINLTVEDVLKDSYQTIIKKFPEDEAYYKTLAKSLGLKEGEEFKLSSIVGSQQLKHILSHSCAEDFSTGENLNHIKDFSHRINLHNHTQASDGKMSIAEFLDNACLYANKRAEKYPSEKYVVAITDHDTTLGAQKALELIIQDPYKYRNLQLVTGCEVSLAHLGKDNKPVFYEVINYAINPFNQKYSEFLKTLRKNRILNTKSTLKSAKELYPSVNISFEEASNFHPNIKRGVTNNTAKLTKQYLLNHPDASKLSPEDFTKYEETISKLCDSSFNPNLTLTPQTLFKTVEECGREGFFSIAHPAKIAPEITDLEPRKNILNDIFKTLKKEGKELFNSCEINYQSYRNGENEALEQYITKLANGEEYKLLHTGGVDAHQNSLFLKNEPLTPEKIDECGLNFLKPDGK